MAEAKASVSPKEPDQVAAKSSAPAPVVIDLGKQKRKKVRRLLKGEGRLFDELQEAVEELQDVGKVKESAQLVFVTVRKKRKRKNIGGCGLGLLK